MKLHGMALGLIGILLVGGCDSGKSGASSGPSKALDTGGGPN